MRVEVGRNRFQFHYCWLCDERQSDQLGLIEGTESEVMFGWKVKYSQNERLGLHVAVPLKNQWLKPNITNRKVTYTEE